MAKKEGKELATVKVYLNTGIIAGLVGVGFVASTLIFGVLIPVSYTHLTLPTKRIV